MERPSIFNCRLRGGVAGNLEKVDRNEQSRFRGSDGTDGSAPSFTVSSSSFEVKSYFRNGGCRGGGGGRKAAFLPGRWDGVRHGRLDRKRRNAGENSARLIIRMGDLIA